MHNRAIIHGCLVAIDGVGVLIVGDAGVGKTSVCLELERVGHNFIADDAVLLRTICNDLIGSAPVETAGSIAIRGVGVVKRLPRGPELLTSVDLIVELVADDETKLELPTNEMLTSIPRIRFNANGSTAKLIESFAIETDRDLKPKFYGKQAKT